MWMQRKRGIFRIAMALGDLDGVHSFPPWCSRTAAGELACNTSLTPCEQNASTPIHINYKTDLLNSNFRPEMFYGKECSRSIRLLIVGVRVSTTKVSPQAITIDISSK
jgi:hypothetical protein